MRLVHGSPLHEDNVSCRCLFDVFRFLDNSATFFCCAISHSTVRRGLCCLREARSAVKTDRRVIDGRRDVVLLTLVRVRPIDTGFHPLPQYGYVFLYLPRWFGTF